MPQALAPAVDIKTRWGCINCATEFAPAAVTYVEFRKIYSGHVREREPGFNTEIQKGVALKFVARPTELCVLAPFVNPCKEPLNRDPVTAWVPILPEANEPLRGRVVSVQTVSKESRRPEGPSGTDYDIHGRGVSQSREGLTDGAPPACQSANGNGLKAGFSQVTLERLERLCMEMVASHVSYPKRRASFGRRITGGVAIAAAPPTALPLTF